MFLAGGAKIDHKLSPADASLVIEAVFADGKKSTLTIGADYEGQGRFAQISTWPGAVFFLPPERVTPILGGIMYFAKERVVAP